MPERQPGSTSCTRGGRCACAAGVVDEDEDFDWSDDGVDLGVGIEWEGRRVSKPHHGLMYRDVDETGGGGVDEHGRLIGPNGLGLESDVGLPDGEVRRLRFESVTKGLGRPNDKETTTAVDMSVPGAGWATGAATVEEKSEPAAARRAAARPRCA